MLPGEGQRSPGGGQTTGAYFGMMVIIGVVYGAAGPTLRGLALQTGVGLAQIGVILSSRSFGYFLASTLAGRLIDRVHAHRFAAGVVLLCALLLALVPVARSLWVLALLTAAIGATLAGLDVGANVLILRLHADHPGPSMNALHLFFGLGGFLAPLLVVATGSETAIGWPYWAMALLILPVAAWILSRPVPPRWNVKHRVDAGRNPSGLIVLGCLVFFFYVGAEIGFSTWIYEYARLTLGGGAATPVTTAFWGAFTLLRFGGIFVAVHGNPRTIAAADLALGFVGSGLVAVGLICPVLVWIGTLLCGGAIASFYATFLVFLSERIPLTGQRVGLLALAATGGSMSFPWLIGRVFESTPMMMPVAVSLNLAIAFALFVYIATIKPKTFSGT